MGEVSVLLGQCPVALLCLGQLLHLQCPAWGLEPAQGATSWDGLSNTECLIQGIQLILIMPVTELLPSLLVYLFPSFSREITGAW